MDSEKTKQQQTTQTKKHFPNLSIIATQETMLTSSNFNKSWVSKINRVKNRIGVTKQIKDKLTQLQAICQQSSHLHLMTNPSTKPETAKKTNMKRKKS